MCRNIKLLFNFEPPATEAEIHASALQYVRKVSGVQVPSGPNAAAWERAVADITEITRRLVLDELQTRGAPRDREIEKQRAKERGQTRDARVLAKHAKS